MQQKDLKTKIQCYSMVNGDEITNKYTSWKNAESFTELANTIKEDALTICDLLENTLTKKLCETEYIDFLTSSLYKANTILNGRFKSACEGDSLEDTIIKHKDWLQNGDFNICKLYPDSVPMDENYKTAEKLSVELITKAFLDEGVLPNYDGITYALSVFSGFMEYSLEKHRNIRKAKNLFAGIMYAPGISNTISTPRIANLTREVLSNTLKINPGTILTSSVFFGEYIIHRFNEKAKNYEKPLPRVNFSLHHPIITNEDSVEEKKTVVPKKHELGQPTDGLWID